MGRAGVIWIPPELPDFLDLLGQRGVEMELVNTRVRYRPKRIAEAYRDGLVAFKPSITELLMCDYCPQHLEAQYVMEERLGLAADCGMPTHLGSPAWLIAVGAAMREDELGDPHSRFGDDDMFGLAWDT